MKKLAIAGASAVIAALPVIGVFAADGPVIDKVQVTVNSSCKMSTGTNSGDAQVTGANLTATVNPGTLVSNEGTGATAWGGSSSTIKFSCNAASGYTLTAQGVKGITGSDATTAQTVMDAATDGVDIVTGTGTSGTPSNWAFKVTATGINGATAAFTDWSLVPEAASPVITATAANPTSEASIAPAYRVWVAANQGADTYTGYVKYVLTVNQ